MYVGLVLLRHFKIKFHFRPNGKNIIYEISKNTFGFRTNKGKFDKKISDVQYVIRGSNKYMFDNVVKAGQETRLGGVTLTCL